VGLVAAVYWFSLDRDVGFGDMGEMQTVPYILGLAHPTGFPSVVVFGWLFTHIVAIGEPALRMSIFCTLCALGSTACCYWIGRVLGAARWQGGFSAGAFALTPVVWERGTQTESVDLAVFACALTLLLAAEAMRRRSHRWILAAGAAGGLALGTHGVVAWFLPAPLLLLLFSRNQEIVRWTVRGLLLGAFVAAALYLYLPLRSYVVTAAQLDPTRSIGLSPGMPFWDWGHPANLAGFLSVVTGRHVGALQPLSSPFSLAKYPTYGVFAWHQLRIDYAAIVAAMLLLLAVSLAFVRTRLVILLLPLLLVTPFAASFGAESTERYYIFPILCLWIAVAVRLSIPGGGAALRLAKSVLTLGVGILILVQLSAGWRFFERGHHHQGLTYMENVLVATPANAIVIAPWVYSTPLAYAAYVRHETGDRILVCAQIEDIASMLPTWLRHRPVYAILESKPTIDQRTGLVRRFGVNPVVAHDPKLYRILPALRR
jgi:4-amino-4-deoxy-L-arabinose transferase-like glycosyltransferase